MDLPLSHDLERMIEQRMRDGGYATAEDVLRAALLSLEQQERFGDFEPGELDALLADGEGSGDPLDGEQVFAELRALRSRPQGKAG